MLISESKIIELLVNLINYITLLLLTDFEAEKDFGAQFAESDT